jgi:uncharacterized protein
MINKETGQKYTNLQDMLAAMGKVAVAFSGGVDSTFLLKIASNVLKDDVLAVTACSATYPERERQEAETFCAESGIRHVLCETDELGIEGFASNPPDRCYLCKNSLYTEIKEIAAQHGIATIIEGSNADDVGDYRPGLRAVAEHRIISPLRDAGLTKDEIRLLSRSLGLKTWDKQPFACLSSRFVHGENITKEKLEMIDRAEQYLLDHGFRRVRVRLHNDLARIEVEREALVKLLDDREALLTYFRECGFRYVTVDLQGFQSGSMNPAQTSP